MTTPERMQNCSKIIEEFQNKCDPDYQNILRVYWDYGIDRETEEKVVEIHVEIQEGENTSVNSTYCYPVANFARERGLYLWDTVTNWEQEVVRLRFRFED